MKRLTLSLVAGVLAVLLLGGTFAAGFAAGRIWEPPIPGVTATGTSVGHKVDEVNLLLQEKALKPADEASATAGAIDGLLGATGDKYAMYFDAEHYKFFTEQTDGEFYGIGVTISEKDGKVYIVSVMEGTPAEKAGVKANDQFVSIDGVTENPWTSDDVVKRVRGPEGTKVKVVMYRPSDKKEYTFDITRARIDIPNVMTKLLGPDKNVGYIRMGSFNAKSEEDLKKAIDDLQKKGAHTFILDLRDDPGGLLQEAVDVASLFIKDGVIVRVDERDKPEKEYRTNASIKAYDVPLVVLVNENSASASEVLSGALQDYNRAALIGTKTFGKGSVQQIEQLSFGGAVKFTTAHYLTPKKRAIDGIGLTPDISVPMKPELQADEKTDVQLQRAIVAAVSRLGK